MKRRSIVWLLVVGIIIYSFTGCGSNSTPTLDVKSKLRVIEKRINKLDTEFLVNNVYIEPSETDSEVVIAAAFLEAVFLDSVDTAVKTVTTIVINNLENSNLVTKKDLAKLVKEWKENILKNFKYEITDYQVIDDARTIHDGAKVVLVEQKIMVNKDSYTGKAYFEFIYQDKKWKFHIISKKDIYANSSENTNGETDKIDAEELTQKSELSKDENNASESLKKVETGSIDKHGINLSYDLSKIRYLFAADNTASMMGYHIDNKFVTLMKGIENTNNSYANSSITTVMGNDKGYYKWFPYDGKVAVGVTRTDKNSYPYYCIGKSYESKYMGPVSLLLDDENNVGAFAANTVTTIVTDLHEQGGSLYTIGTDIRKKCIENLGNEDEFAIAIFYFDFYYDGTSWIVDPRDPSKSISAIFDGSSDKRPLYVIMAGQKEGVYDFVNILKKWLKQNDLSYEMVDNLKVIEDSNAQIELFAGESAVASDINELIKSNSDSKEEELEEYVNSHITRLIECDEEQIVNFTSSEIDSDSLCYMESKLEINSSYKGYWNWIGKYATEIKNDATEIPYTVACNGVKIYQDLNGTWKQLSEKEWKKMFNVLAADGIIRISCISENPEVKFKKQNFKFIFDMEKSIEKKISYPSWIKKQDFSLSGVEDNPDEKLWHQKTMDLDFFCRSLLSLSTTETTIDCGISHSDSIEIVLFNVSNKQWLF